MLGLRKQGEDSWVTLFIEGMPRCMLFRWGIGGAWGSSDPASCLFSPWILS